jgi:hypothetical protein
MLCENCEKVILKSIQRKYYKTVMNIEMGQEFFVESPDENKKDIQIPLKVKEENNNKLKEVLKEKKLMIFD